MNTKRSKSIPFLIGALSFLVVFLLAAFAPAELAGSQTLPVRPTLTPTATPIVSPTPTPIPTSVAPTLTPPNADPPALPAAIYLHVEPVTAGLWTAVQWQDGDQWRSVAGWQAPLNDEGIVAWAVAEANFGERPFRWLIYDRQGGELIATSETFALPNHEQHIVRVNILLPLAP